MNVKVQLFARARDLAGASVVEVEVVEPATVGGLRAALGHSYPALAPLLPRLHVAVNSEYAADGDPVPSGAEIACFPPVSGG
jgi:sulfur-carrier protein